MLTGTPLALANTPGICRLYLADAPQATRPRVDAAVEQLYAEIPIDWEGRLPPGYTLVDEYLDTKTFQWTPFQGRRYRYARGLVRTRFRYQDAESGEVLEGQVVREMKEVEGRPMLSLDTANLSASKTLATGKTISLPRWIRIEGVPDLVVGQEGVPVVTFLTLRQLKIWGIQPGELNSVYIERITSTRTMLDIASAVKRWKRLNPGAEPTEADWDPILRETHTYRYSETAWIQSGHRALRARLVRARSQISLADFVAKLKPNERPDLEDVQRSYGLDPQDTVYWIPELKFDLEPDPAFK